MLRKINENLDRLLEEKETGMAMALSEHSLRRFLEKEPDIYSIKDIKVKHK